MLQRGITSQFRQVLQPHSTCKSRSSGLPKAGPEERWIRLCVPAARCARVVLVSFAFRPIRGRRECRALDAPVASRGEKNTRVSHHGHAGSPGIPRAMVLTVSFALSRVTGLSCHPRRWSKPHQLDASVGASGPHDFAVRAQCHSSFDVAASTASRTLRS